LGEIFTGIVFFLFGLTETLGTFDGTTIEHIHFNPDFAFAFIELLKVQNCKHVRGISVHTKK